MELLQYHGDHGGATGDCGLCRTSPAVAPRLRCDGGIRQKQHFKHENNELKSVVILPLWDVHLGHYVANVPSIRRR